MTTSNSFWDSVVTPCAPLTRETFKLDDLTDYAGAEDADAVNRRMLEIMPHDESFSNFSKRRFEITRVPRWLRRRRKKR